MKRNDLLNREPNIGDLVCWNPAKYKGLLYGKIIKFSKNNGLPIILADEVFHNKYYGQTNSDGPNTYTPKTGFIIIKTLT
jgi:hypothetical protein